MQYLGRPSFTVVASASSGLPVSFSSSTASVCTVSGGMTANGSTIATVSTVARGTCSITAIQPGRLSYIAAPAVMQSFTVADPTTATINQSVSSSNSGVPYTITWDSVSATSCTFDISRNGGAPFLTSISLRGTRTDNTVFVVSDDPNYSYDNYTYRNTCQGPSGTSVATVNHTVFAPPPNASISQSSTSTVSGSPYVVSWNSTNAIVCKLYASRNGETPILIFSGLSGTQTVSPSVVGTHVWTNQCQGAGFLATTATFTHTVTPLPIVTSSISQSLTTTVSGSPYTVSWSSTDATSCSVDASRNGEVPIVIFTGLNGTQTVSPAVVGTHVWRNICQGAGGSATSTFTHTVTAN